MTMLLMMWLNSNELLRLFLRYRILNRNDRNNATVLVSGDAGAGGAALCAEGAEVTGEIYRIEPRNK